jgi:DNA polymerase III delta prime subunit
MTEGSKLSEKKLKNSHKLSQLKTLISNILNKCYLLLVFFILLYIKILFFREYICPSFKIIILDEADLMTNDA